MGDVKGIVRIQFGSTKYHDEKTEKKHMMKHMVKGQKKVDFLKIADGKQGIATKDSDLKAKCKKAHEKLKEGTVDKSENPYADKDNSIHNLATVIRDLVEEEQGGRTSEEERTEAIIEKVAEVIGMGKGLPLHYDKYYHRDEIELVTAGSILTEKNRRMKDETAESELLMVQDQIEIMMLAASVMRSMKINAYPAFTVWSAGDDNEARFPVMAILEHKSDVPLTTFVLDKESYPIHPPSGAVDLITDEGVVGVTYTLQAQNTVKKLGLRMVGTMEKENKPIDEKERDELLDLTAQLLHESHLRCEYALFSMNFMGQAPVDRTEDIMENIPNMHPQQIVEFAMGELGIFEVIYNAYQQLHAIEIMNNTSPENVEGIMQNPGIVRGRLEDGFRVALDYRRKVQKMYVEIAEKAEEGWN